MEEALKAMMIHTVTVAPYASQDKYGAPTFSAAKTYHGLVQQRVRQVRSATGEERVSNVTVYLDTTDAVTPRDKLTLPAGFVPQSPPILAVGRQADEAGLHHTVVYA